MKEPIWLSATDIYGIHREIIARLGGRCGIFDVGAIARNLTKPKNVFFYGAPGDLFELAAVYGYGFVKSQSFIDGNGPVGFLAVYTFLAINGWELMAPAGEAIQVFSGLNRTPEAQSTAIARLSQWLRHNTQAIATIHR